jgi:hypothetical protein
MRTSTRICMRAFPLVKMKCARANVFQIHLFKTASVLRVRGAAVHSTHLCNCRNRPDFLRRADLRVGGNHYQLQCWAAERSPGRHPDCWDRPGDRFWSTHTHTRTHTHARTRANTHTCIAQALLYHVCPLPLPYPHGSLFIYTSTFWER